MIIEKGKTLYGCASLRLLYEVTAIGLGGYFTFIVKDISINNTRANTLIMYLLITTTPLDLVQIFICQSWVAQPSVLYR